MPLPPSLGTEVTDGMMVVESRRNATKGERMSATPAEIEEIDRNVIWVTEEDFRFLERLLNEPPEDLPWVREVPERLFLDF